MNTLWREVILTRPLGIDDGRGNTLLLQCDHDEGGEQRERDCSKRVTMGDHAKDQKGECSKAEQPPIHFGAGITPWSRGRHSGLGRARRGFFRSVQRQ